MFMHVPMPFLHACWVGNIFISKKGKQCDTNQLFKTTFKNLFSKLIQRIQSNVNSYFSTGGFMETEAAAQESLGLGKLGTQAEKDRRLKKK